MNVEGGATTTVQANNASKVALNVSGGEEIIVAGAASGQVTEVTGTIGDGAENTTFTLKGNGGNFTVKGEGMSALSNLTVEGAGATTVDNLTSEATSFDLTTDSDVTFLETNLDSVETLNISNSSEEADVSITGLEREYEDGQDPKYLGFASVNEVNVTSDAKVTLNFQLGSMSVESLIVNAGEGGLSIGGAGICSKGATFNGSGVADDIMFAPRGSAELNMGAGADTVVCQLGYGQNRGDIFTATIDMGANDNAQDIIKFYSDTLTNAAYANRLGGAFMTVENFEFGTDKLGLHGSWTSGATSCGGDFSTWETSIGTTKATAMQINSLLSAFETGVSVQTEGTDYNIVGKLLVVGSDAYALYYTPQTEATSDPSTVAFPHSVSDGDDVDACALVKLVGIGESITDATAAASVFA